MSALDRIGIRELRQNLSVYLRRVQAGEALEVTDRGRSVALFVPLGEDDTPLERLVRAGRAVAPKGSLFELGRPVEGVPRSLGEALDAERGER